jgi:nitrogen regulatory protein PII
MSAQGTMSKFQEGLQAQRKLVEQLRAEAAVQRLQVSECVTEIIKFCDQQGDGDVLITGFPKQSDNPFKEKGGCTII